jgi:hypothetical protein
MIVTHAQERRQQPLAPRKERRPQQVKFHKERRKLLKKLKDVNLGVEFDNKTTTAYGNFSLVETFKTAIGIKEIIGEKLKVHKHHNSVYDAVTLVDYLIDACALGHTRFEHIEGLGYDPGYKAVKGIDTFPSEGRFRDVMSRMDQQNIEELIEINRRLIELRSQYEGPQEVWLDYDDSVITLFGNQEGGAVGYNPRYHGRPSYKAKVCFIAGSDELLLLDLYSGDTHSNGEFLEFHKRCEELLPHNYVLKGVRTDKGFMGEDNIEYYEQACLEYVVKHKMTERLKTQILALEDGYWNALDDTWSVTEMEYLPSHWKHPKKLVIVKEKIVAQTGQLYLPVKEVYKYQAIMTNMEGEPEEIWRFYNKRGQAENKIGELKEGFGLEEASQSAMLKNRAFALIKSISYNLLSWFRRLTIPENRYEMATLRRKIINVPGNIVGSGWYRKIRLAPNRFLEKSVAMIKHHLQSIFDFVANGFKPLSV